MATAGPGHVSPPHTSPSLPQSHALVASLPAIAPTIGIVSPSIITNHPLSSQAPNRVSIDTTIREDDCPVNTNLVINEQEFPSLNASAPTPSKISYATIIKEAKASIKGLEKLQITYSEVEGKRVAAIPPSIFSSPPLWDDLLVGKFPPGQAPHVAKVHVIVNKIWAQGNKNIRIDAYPVNDSTIKFRIRDFNTRSRVLKRCHWTIADRPMFLHKWSPNTSDFQPTMKTIPLWITIQNIPRSLFSWEGISLIASSIGVPKRLHQDTELCLRFEEAKVLIETDLTKTLPQDFIAKDHDGSIKKITFVYPKMPLFCSTCHEWGHTAPTCPVRATHVETSSAAPQDHIAIQPVPSQENECNLPTMEDIIQNNAPSKTTTPIATDNNSLLEDFDNKKTTIAAVTSNSEENSAETATMPVTNAPVAELPINQEQNQEWKIVSPKKISRSPASKGNNDPIKISSSFNVLLEADHEEGEISVRGQKNNMASLEVTADIRRYSEQETTSQQAQPAEEEASMVPARPGSTRQRKPSLKFQNQVQASSSTKVYQSKRQPHTRK